MEKFESYLWSTLKKWVRRVVISSLLGTVGVVLLRPYADLL
ncbi:hypothetical protein GO283_01975 [Ralstonia solanacearum]|nr:hypothetical protein [Ralstonia solanacearum]